MDVIELLGVPVTVTCVGRAEGAAVGVVAVAARRRANPHARFLLREPRAQFDRSANEALRFALVDEIAGPAAGVRRLPARGVGFRPL